MKYQTQINATEPDNWSTTQADDIRDAALEAVRAVGVDGVTWPCTVYVGDPNPKLRHPNGSPFLVHAFTLEINKESEAQAA